MLDQPARYRHHQKLTEGSGGCGDAHGHGSFLCRDVSPQDAVDHGVGAASLRQADRHPGEQGEGERGTGLGHAPQAQGIEGAAHPEHFQCASAIGPPAHKGARSAPNQVLNRQGDGKSFSAPLACTGDGLKPQPKAVSNPHGQGHDQGAAKQELPQGQRSLGGMHGRLASPACREESLNG